MHDQSVYVRKRGTYILKYQIIYNNINPSINQCSFTITNVGLSQKKMTIVNYIEESLKKKKRKELPVLKQAVLELQGWEDKSADDSAEDCCPLIIK